MACHVHGPQFDPFRTSVNDSFWLGSPREFETFDAAAIFVMELAPYADLDKVEIQGHDGEIHTILAIARRYREITRQ